MRNWNSCISTSDAAVTFVFILPMRNWNLHVFGVQKIGFTSFHSTYEELKRATKEAHSKWDNGFSFYLWGIETSTIDSFIGSKAQVFILPMRNWNIFDYTGDEFSITGFHSTYEELKHQNQCSRWDCLERFHSTYEELKLAAGAPDEHSFVSFHSTYEELKPLRIYHIFQH